MGEGDLGRLASRWPAKHQIWNHYLVTSNACAKVHGNLSVQRLTLCIQACLLSAILYEIYVLDLQTADLAWCDVVWDVLGLTQAGSV